MTRARFSPRHPLLGDVILPAVSALPFTLLWAAGGPANAQGSTQAEKPATPTGLSVSAIKGSLDVSVDWDDVAGADDYWVRWRTKGGNLNQGMSPTSSNAEITVTDYGTWVVRVQACNVAGCGSPAAEGFTVEPAPTATPTPTPAATPTNVDEAPTITGGPTAVDFVEDGAGAVATYAATDPEKDIISWTVAGADAGKFNSSASGALSFKTTPDFESPGDADGNNRYQVTVKATANGKSATRNVTVTATDNEPPGFLPNQNVASRTTQENYGPGITVGYYAAKDPEGDEITLTLAGADADEFTLEFQWNWGGAYYYSLMLNATSDYESPDDADKDGVFEVTLQATDTDGSGETEEFDVKVTVQDVDEAPVITGPAAVDFPENSTGDVGTYSAADPEGETTTLIPGGTDAASFTFTNGALAFRDAPDYEAKSSYSVTFTA